MAAKQAHSIGRSCDVLAVISVTRIIAVKGARQAPLKSAVMPISAKAVGDVVRLGAR